MASCSFFCHLQFSNTGRFANELVRQRPVRQRICQFANTYMLVTSGPNVQNTFSFGSAVDERTRNKKSCMALSSGYTYLAVCFAPQWIKERGIIDMRARVKLAPNSVVWRRW